MTIIELLLRTFHWQYSNYSCHFLVQCEIYTAYIKPSLITVFYCYITQASILSHKKETLASALQAQKEEAAAIEQELFAKRKTLQDLGGEVLKGDDVSSLR